MQTASSTHASNRGDYVVAAPQAGDVLTMALRAAYRAERADDDSFADLIRQIDGVAPAQIRQHSRR